MAETGNQTFEREIVMEQKLRHNNFITFEINLHHSRKNQTRFQHQPWPPLPFFSPPQPLRLRYRLPLRSNLKLIQLRFRPLNQKLKTSG